MAPDNPLGSQETLNLPPGFRFRPTDEELVVHYLFKKVACKPFSLPIIAEVDLYKFDPWDLPGKAFFGENEWYFFSLRDRKYPNGSRPSRTAGSGYWKATGVDKSVFTMGGIRKVGIKKSLVFYKGRTTSAIKTNWIMHEYRLADGGKRPPNNKGALRLDGWVLCRIYKKVHTAKDKEDKDSTDSGSASDILDNSPHINGTRIMEPSQLNTRTVFLAEHYEESEQLSKNMQLETKETIECNEIDASEYQAPFHTKCQNSSNLYYGHETCNAVLNSGGNMDDTSCHTSCQSFSSRLHDHRQRSTPSFSTYADPHMSNGSSIQHSGVNCVNNEFLDAGGMTIGRAAFESC